MGSVLIFFCEIQPSSWGNFQFDNYAIMGNNIIKQFAIMRKLYRNKNARYNYVYQPKKTATATPIAIPVAITVPITI